MNGTLVRRFSVTLMLVTVFGLGMQRGWAAPLATTTALAVSSAAGPVTTVKSGSIVTLTATVTSGTSAVTAGQVKFCDASTAYCTDIHLFGIGQLTSGGTATLKFAPGIGTHSYKAIFTGTATGAASSSASASLSVSGLFPTTTALSQGGSASSYSLTASVAGIGGLIAPTGTVSFVDASNGNTVLGTGLLGASSTSLSFLNPSNPVAGNNPASIVIGDFNNDGIPDLAVANSGDGTVTILLGKGDGTFVQAAKSPIAVGDYPWSLAVSDFNGDGKADLAVVNSGDNSVAILLGNGDGTFSASPPVNVGRAPDFLAVGDFNGDGVPDLAVVNSSDFTVSILLGKGDGTFTQATDSPISVSYPFSLTVGDFNADGISDLAVVNSYGLVAIFLGKGDGTFTQSPTQVVAGQDPVSIAVADFNGDGIPDMAVANYGDNSVTISIGNGDGTFQQAANSTIAVGNQPISVVVGDFNADGIPDLAVANFGDNTVTIVLGNGDGTFRQTANGTVAVGAGPISLAALDLNEDGISDLAVANLGGSTATVLLSDLTETAQATLDISAVGIVGHSVAAGYPGDSNYNSSVSNSLSVSGQLVMPTVIVTPALSSITTAQPLSVTVTVSGGASAPTPTGSVTLTSGNFSAAPTPLTAGTVTIIIPAGSLALGAGTLSASYTPDSSSSATYSSGIGTAPVVVSPPALITPTVTLIPSSANTATTQGLTVTVAVSGPSGYPTPTGLVTLTSSIPNSGSAPLIYDTFQYPNDTLINGKTAQSGNSVWTAGGHGVGEVEENHLMNSAPSDEPGTLYAELANTSTAGGMPSPVTTLGGTIRMCPSLSGTYNPGYTSVGLIATRDGTFQNSLEIGFGPTSWWVLKNVNGVATTLLTGTENLPVDCKTDYTVQLLLNPTAGTFQVIPPSGVPSAVITDPDITAIDALYGVWEPEDNAPYKYRGQWGSVWMGGGYTSSAATLSAGTATITIPAGSLALGSDTLTASFTPDSASAPIYVGSTSAKTVVNVSKATPLVTMTSSSANLTTTQALTVTVAVSGGGTAPTPTGTVIIKGGGYTSPSASLSQGTVAITIPAGSLAVGAESLTATYNPDPSSSPTYNGASSVSSTVSVAKVTPTVSVTPSLQSLSALQALSVQIAVNGGSGTPFPTGTVIVTGGGTTPYEATLSAGLATVSIPAGSLAAGASTLTATYSGDPTYNSSTGSTNVTVTQIAITLSNVSLISPGTSVTATASITGAGSYTGTMNLTCALSTPPSNAQSLPTCSLSPTSLAITAGQSGSTVVTVHTTSNTIAAGTQAKRQYPWLFGEGGAVLAGVLLFGFSPRRRRWMSMLIVLAVIAAAGTIGCGGAGIASIASSGASTQATTKGNYTFTVTGTDSVNPAITASTSLTITVQ